MNLSLFPDDEFDDPDELDELEEEEDDDEEGELAIAGRSIRRTRDGRCINCQRPVLIYPRSINCSQARELICLARLNRDAPDAYFKTTEFPYYAAGGDFAKLRYWNLIEEKLEPSTIGAKTSGQWRITPSGVAFVYRRLKVVKTMHVFQGRVVWSEGELVDIVDCLGKRFSYDELMAGAI